MGSTGRHVAGAPAGLTPGNRGEAERARRAAQPPEVTWSPDRLGVTAMVAALVSVAGIIAAVLAASSSRAAAPQASPRHPPVIATVNAVPAITGHGGRPAPPARRNAVPLVLTAADRRHCPVTATACVDLDRHITWLQARSQITFGPVLMEPGKPGSRHQTPRGTFRVAWKAGPAYQSTIYHEPMPWATFFAVGGIAFHGGSLTTWSHGCVHLTVANAHYYSRHLPIGAQVVVF